MSDGRGANRAELRELATDRLLTHGPWRERLDGPNPQRPFVDNHHQVVAVTWVPADARFIAAADPLTVLSLLDEIERLRIDKGVLFDIVRHPTLHVPGCEGDWRERACIRCSQLTEGLE